MSREQLLELAAGMREAADWIEANADLPMDAHWAPEFIGFRVAGREQMSAAGRALMPFDKLDKGDCWAADYDYIIARMFGPLRLQIHCDRGKICKKVTVMKPVEEWSCEDSILAPELPVQA